jgi:hypothetical protein
MFPFLFFNMLFDNRTLNPPKERSILLHFNTSTREKNITRSEHFSILDMSKNNSVLTYYGANNTLKEARYQKLTLVPDTISTVSQLLRVTFGSSSDQLMEDESVSMSW